MPPPQDDLAGKRPYVARHAAVGWWSVLAFGTLGLILETLHGLKVAAYLDAAHETRRLMWTLAHAHGTLLGLLHLAFAATLPFAAGLSPRHQAMASKALMGASLLLPGGFFLGGLRFYSGDPGIGIALVPPGALLLLTAAFLMGRGVSRR